MSFATQKPPLAASQMALIRQLSFAAKTRSQIVWDRDLGVSVGGNLAVNMQIANLCLIYINCQYAIVVHWEPVNAECPLFVVNLQEHLIFPVFHLLECFVFVVVQVLSKCIFLFVL